MKALLVVWVLFLHISRTYGVPYKHWDRDAGDNGQSSLSQKTCGKQGDQI